MRNIEEINNELQEIAVQINELEHKRHDLYSDLRYAEKKYADKIVNGMMCRYFVREWKTDNYDRKEYKIYYKKTKSGYYHKRTFVIDYGYLVRIDNDKTIDASYLVSDLRDCKEISVDEFKNIISKAIEERISKLNKELTEQFNEVIL